MTAQVGGKVFTRDFKAVDRVARNYNMWMCLIRHGAHGFLILSARSDLEADVIIIINTGWDKEENGILYLVLVADYTGLMGGVDVVYHKEILQNPADV